MSKDEAVKANTTQLKSIYKDLEETKKKLIEYGEYSAATDLRIPIGKLKEKIANLLTTEFLGKEDDSCSTK